MREQLIDVAAQLVDRRFLHQSEHRQLMMAARAHLVAIAAAQHVGHVRGAKALADARDTRQDLSRDGDRVGYRFELAKAVIAGAAVVLGERFAEVTDQPLVAAADAGSVALDIAQQRAPRIRQLAVLFQHHPPLQEVGARRDQDAFGFEAITSRAAGLLLIVLE